MKPVPSVQAIISRENVKQRTEEWYRKRKGLLTASDAATALGLNPYKTAKSLMVDKCCPDLKKSSDSAATMHGNKYEDEAVALYEELYEKEVLLFGLFVSEQHPWLGGSPDGVTKDGILVEAKWCVSFPPASCMTPSMVDG